MKRVKTRLTPILLAAASILIQSAAAFQLPVAAPLTRFAGGVGTAGPLLAGRRLGTVERLRGGALQGRSFGDEHSFGPPAPRRARSGRGLPGLLSSLSGDLASRNTPPPPKASAVYLLVLLNVAVFLVQTFSGLNLQSLFLNHMHPQLFQFVTSTLCHANAGHLSSNMFPLLVFGRLVEDEMGFLGLILTFFICGAASNMASIVLMPSATLSLGASGAVFGLFTAAVAVRVSLRDFAWRSWVEAAVFGQYVWERLRTEVVVTAGGGVAGVNHVAHLGGAAAGIVMIMGLRLLLGAMEPKDPKSLRGD